MAVTVNNVTYDGGTIEVAVDGVGAFTGIEAINYGRSKEVNKQKGTGIKHRGRGPGILMADDASMDMWLAEHNNWIAAIGSEDEWLQSVFDVTITYRIDDDSPLIAVKLVDCTPLSYAAAHSTGADTLVVPVTFSVMDIER